MGNFSLILRRGLIFAVGLLISSIEAILLAQSGAGAAGIDAASAEIGGMFDSTSKLILAIAAVVGLIGGVRCYIKWNTGDQDVMKSVMGWGGACIFIVIVSLVIRAFFGL